jgi:hypothetical protein
MKKIFQRTGIVVGLFGIAAIAGRLGDWASGRQPPPARAVARGASLVAGVASPAKNEKPVALSFDTFKQWTYIEKQKTPIPDFIRKYDGKEVQMLGYMMPLSEIKDIKTFVLVPSLFGCCYGQPPAVNHIVFVKMAGDSTAKFFSDSIRVRGQFHCGEEKQDGYVISLYRIDADQITAQ